MHFFGRLSAFWLALRHCDLWLATTEMLLINTLMWNAVYKTRSHHDSDDDCNSCAHQALADLGPSVEVVSLGSLRSDCSLLLYHRQLSISVHWKTTTSKHVQTSILGKFWSLRQRRRQQHTDMIWNHHIHSFAIMPAAFNLIKDICWWFRGRLCICWNHIKMSFLNTERRNLPLLFRLFFKTSRGITTSQLGILSTLLTFIDTVYTPWGHFLITTHQVPLLLQHSKYKHR